MTGGGHQSPIRETAAGNRSVNGGKGNLQNIAHAEAISATKEEAALRARSGGGRIYQLDALRGLAAVLVVAHHARLVNHGTIPPWYLAPFLAGPQAVCLFFVLSGFVLSLPYLKGRSQPYKTYAVRRIARIYLPFALAAALSIAISLPFHKQHLPLSPWFQGQWRCSVTWQTVAAQMCMWPTECFNTALWSIWFEMQLSLLMPLIMKAMLRWNSGLILIGSLTAAFLKVSLLQHMDLYLRLGYTLQIGSLFVLGAFLALHEQRLRGLLRSSGGHAWWIFAVFLFIFFNYPSRFSTSLFVRSWLVEGIGAAGILVCSLEMKPLAAVLRHGVAEYLGRISFSLYLLHSIFVLSMFDLLYGKLPNVAIYLAIGVFSLVSAHLFCIFVEEPCIQLARRIGGHSRGRFNVLAAS